MFSLRTKSYKSAIHASKSVSQRLEDYWLGLRLQKIDIPALQLVKSDDVSDDSCLVSEARELYLRLKAVGKDKVFMPMHYEETNILTNQIVDPYSRQPNYKGCSINYKKIKGTCK